MIYKKFDILLNGKVLKQINRRKAKRLFENGIEIFVVPCKVRFHSPWSSPCKTDCDAPENKSFNSFVNEFEYYNCTNETGLYTHYFTEEINM
jgi:hypothetical protein